MRLWCVVDHRHLRIPLEHTKSSGEGESKTLRINDSAPNVPENISLGVSFALSFFSTQITPREALVAELKFAVNIRATTKPVKIGKTNSSVSSVESGLGRGSTARSIVGSFLRLDMLDKFDKDRDANNRSNDRKIN